MSVARNSYLKNTTGGDFTEQKQGGTILGLSADTNTSNSLPLKESCVDKIDAGQKETGAATKIVANGEFGKMRDSNYTIMGVLSSIANLESFTLSFLGGAGEGIGDRKSRETIKTQKGLEFTAPTDSSSQIALNLSESNGAFDVTVDWGDGSTSNIKVWNDSAATHTYSSQGSKTIKITGTLGQQMYFNKDVEHIATMHGWGGTSLRQWGSVLVDTGESLVYADYNNDLDQMTAGLAELIRDKPAGKYLGDYMANIEDWNVSSVTDFQFMFIGPRLAAYVDVVNGNYTFTYPNKFNRDISKWDVSNATILQSMFSGNSEFNQDISNWDVSNVTDFYGVFQNATSFNQPVQRWDISNAENIGSMFLGADSFDQDMGEWKDILPTGINKTGRLFAHSDSFNNGGSDSIKNWVLPSGSRLDLFQGTSKFNQPIGSMDVSNIGSYYEGFRDATAFNQDIGSWDVSGATFDGFQPFSRMFRGATSFNNGGSDSIKNWRWTAAAGRAADHASDERVALTSMFQNASSFNQPIGEWDTSEVGTFNSIFDGATSFDQDISSWDFSHTLQKNDQYSLYFFLRNGKLSTSNYDALLIKWESQSQSSRPKTIDMGTSTYTSGGAAETARTALVNDGWVITDGGTA